MKTYWLVSEVNNPDSVVQKFASATMAYIFMKREIQNTEDLPLVLKTAALDMLDDTYEKSQESFEGGRYKATMVKEM